MSIRASRCSWLLAVILTLAGTIVPVATVRAQDTDDAAALRDFFSANGLLNRGLHEMAVEEYRGFLEQYPDHEKAAVARYGLGVALFRLGRSEETVVALEPLRETPRFAYAAEVSIILGQCHLTLRQYDRAATRFQDILDDHLDHALADDAAALQTEAYHLAGRYDRAAGPAKLLVSRWPESPLCERAELYWSLSAMARSDYALATERLRGMQRRYRDGEYADQVSLLLAQSLHRTSAARLAIEQYRQVLSQAHDTYAPEALYGLSILLHADGKRKAAGELLDELLERFPEHESEPAARILRGRVLFEEGKYEKARRLFETVAATTGEHTNEAMYWAAKCELRGGAPDAAAERLRQAMKRYPKSRLMPQMMYDASVSLLQADRVEDGLEQLRRFRERFPEDALGADALHLMAATEHRRQSFDGSLEHCETFRAAYPDHPLAGPVAFLAAENLFLASDYEDAAAAYRSFLEAYPEDAQRGHATYRLGLALYHQGALDEAEPFLTQVAHGPDLDEVHLPALLALGDLHFQRGEWPEAEAVLTRYLANGDDRPSADDARLKLGLAEFRQGDDEAALTAFDHLLAAFPESDHRLHATFERGQTLVALERHEEAARAFLAVVEQDVDSRFQVHAMNHLGAIAVRSGAYDEAAVHFARVAKDTEDEATAIDALARCGQAQMAAGDFAEAARTYARLIERFPDASVVLQSRAQQAISLARAGEHEKALDVMAIVASLGDDELGADVRTAMAYEKAWCLRALHREADAAEAYRSLLSEPVRNDLSRHALLELAELEADAGNLERAAKRLRTLLQDTDADDPAVRELREQAMYRLGVCEYARDRHADAAAQLERFLAAHPDSSLLVPASALCGESFFRSGAHERAIPYLQRVVDTKADDDTVGPALLRLGECMAVLQRWPESEAAFARYLKRFPKADMSYQAEFGVGWAQENQGRRDAAMKVYRRVVDRHQGPTAARAQFQIGECLFAEKRYEEAARALLKVDILYAYPEWSAAGLYEAARCFQELKDPVRARDLFEQVRQDHADLRWGKLAKERLDEIARSGLPGHGTGDGN